MTTVRLLKYIDRFSHYVHWSDRYGQFRVLRTDPGGYRIYLCFYDMMWLRQELLKCFAIAVGIRCNIIFRTPEKLFSEFQ